MQSEKQSMVKIIFGMMINPAGVIKKAILNTKWYLSIAISALAFGLFFMQTGLDLFKTGQKGIVYVILTILVGLLYGIIVIPFIASIMWCVLKLAKSDKTIIQTISLFCLSYSGALIYGIIGIAFSLILGWNTAVAFGVTGVLWAIGPMIITIREITGGKNGLSIFISTLSGAIVLISWTFLGNI